MLYAVLVAVRKVGQWSAIVELVVEGCDEPGSASVRISRRAQGKSAPSMLSHGAKRSPDSMQVSLCCCAYLLKSP
jgi:hypothetical protein